MARFCCGATDEHDKAVDRIMKHCTVTPERVWFLKPGCTRHVDVRKHFLRELKEAVIVKFVWVKGEMNSADIFTKTLPKETFERHAVEYVGKDKYMG